MDAIFAVVVPVFVLVALGYLARRTGLLGAEASKILNDFVYYFALPAILFLQLAEIDPAALVQLEFLAAHYGAMLAVFGLSTLLVAVFRPMRFAAATLHGLAGCVANTGYMGVPLFLAAYGEAGLLPAVISMSIQASLVNSLAFLLVEIDVSAGKGLLKAIGSVAAAVLRNPLVIGPALGLAVAFAGIELPAAIRGTAKLIGAAAGPCALFAVGVFMYGQKLAGDKYEIAYLTLMKLVVHPALAWVIAYRVLDMDPFWAHSAVLLAALPTAATLFVVAQRYGIYERRALGVLLLSTAAGVLSVSGWVLILPEVTPPGP